MSIRSDPRLFPASEDAGHDRIPLKLLTAKGAKVGEEGKEEPIDRSRAERRRLTFVRAVTCPCCKIASNSYDWKNSCRNSGRYWHRRTALCADAGASSLV